MVDPDDGAPLESRPPLLEDLLTICRALNERVAPDGRTEDGECRQHDHL